MSIDVATILRETFIERVEHHLSLASTNDRAAQCAREESDRSPLLVVADRQTKGRGRGSNRWWTGDGSLAMSLLVAPDVVGADRERSPLVALAAAVAVVDAVASRLPDRQVGIHWPNDVLVRDATLGSRKLAGILIEVLPDRRHIIGIGLNTNNTLADAPPELHATACTLRDLAGVEQDQFDVLLALLRCLDHEFTELRANPARLVDRVNTLCLQRDCLLTIENAGKTTTGSCRGIASDGALMIETAVGQQQFVSGIVRPT